jgi:hypothetical protein
MWRWLKSWFQSVDFSKVDSVLKESAIVCGYLPTINTVIAILALGNPALGTASAVAGAICRALHGPQTLVGGPEGRPKPQIEGVVVEGSYIGK